MPQPFNQLPASLRTHASVLRLTEHEIPVLLVHPDRSRATKPPIVLWFHGRTVNKELDPGRYLRWMRAGIGACAVDLPGHGERFSEELQTPSAAWDVLLQTVGEIDPLLTALAEREEFDMSRMGIGGMSLGGMATLVRLSKPHRFCCAAVEATTGSWTEQLDRDMFRNQSPAIIHPYEPIRNLASWQEIPLLALHSRLDEWIRFEGQASFIHALRQRYENPDLVDFVVYDQTGAPAEHIGFGRMSADAKDRQTNFLRKWLVERANEFPRNTPHP